MVALPEIDTLRLMLPHLGHGLPGVSSAGISVPQSVHVLDMAFPPKTCPAIVAAKENQRTSAPSGRKAAFAGDSS
jgi:hypothetical protein